MSSKVKTACVLCVWWKDFFNLESNEKFTIEKPCD